MIVPGLQLRRAGAIKNATPIALAPGGLPTSVRLFHWGWNDFSPRAYTFVSLEQARVVVARQGSRKISFDWEHEPGPSYGYGDLTIHTDGLYVDGIRWTELGAAVLTTKGAISVSPAYYDDSRRWLHSMVNVALTATPATVFARQLVAASQKKAITMTPEEFIEWCRKTLGVDATAALEVLAKALEDALAAAANATGAAVPSNGAPPAQAMSAPAAAPAAGVVPGAGGMSLVAASALCDLLKIDPKLIGTAAGEAALIAAAARASASGDLSERITKIEASARQTSAAERGAAALAAFRASGEGPKQPPAAALPTSGTDRQKSINEYAAKRGITPEKLAAYGDKTGYGKAV